MKKLRKLAIIRTNDETPCPFGLNIIDACKTAGNSVDGMEPINDPDEDTQQIEINLQILNKNPEPAKCKYAAHLFKNKNKVVDCDFGDTAAGLSQDAVFVGSPYYTRINEGLGIGDFHQTDGSEYRNLYYGIYEWASDRRTRSIFRCALLEVLKIIKS